MMKMNIIIIWKRVVLLKDDDDDDVYFSLFIYDNQKNKHRYLYIYIPNEKLTSFVNEYKATAGVYFLIGLIDHNE